MPRRVGNYTLLETLGGGAFASVRLAHREDDDTRWALKILSKHSIIRDRLGSRLAREVALLRALDHPYIVKITDAFQSANNVYIVMELAKNGELFSLIERRGKLDEATCRRYFVQLIDAVSYCHAQGVAHRDIKPENLLLDANYNLKLSDFGLSNFQSHSQLLETVVGSPRYMAPEVEWEVGYDGFAADTWSCGVVLYVMASGCFPFPAKYSRTYELVIPTHFSPQLADLLTRLLSHDAADRPKLQDLFNHPWIRDADPNKSFMMSVTVPVVLSDDKIAAAVPTISDEDVLTPPLTGQEPPDAFTPDDYSLLALEDPLPTVVELSHIAEAHGYVTFGLAEKTSIDEMLRELRAAGCTVKTLNEESDLKGFISPGGGGGAITTFSGSISNPIGDDDHRVVTFRVTKGSIAELANVLCTAAKRMKGRFSLLRSHQGMHTAPLALSDSH